MLRLIFKFLLFIAIVTSIAVAIIVFQVQSSYQYEFVTVSQGTLKNVVNATGTLKPLNSVLVGAQVTGLVEDVYIDDNDPVEAGQLLAKIDTKRLAALLQQAKTNYELAIIKKNIAQREYKRGLELFENKNISDSRLDELKTNFDIAAQEVKIAEADVNKVQVEYDLAFIRSPIDGIVLKSHIEDGQTITAGFQTPVLFEIAENLRQMEIETDISESEISQIEVGQTAEFEVDAYPNQKFKGSIAKIFYSPQYIQNVVTYKVSVNIRNKDNMFFPGMTAFVNIQVNQNENTLFVENEAFRVLPQTIPNLKSVPKNSNDGKIPVYLWENNEIKVVFVKKGLSTFSQSEIISDEIKEGDRLITGVIEQ